MPIKLTTSLQDFIESLEPETTAKVLRTIDLLEQFTYKLSMPHSKKLQNNLYELRTKGKQEVRIFYTFKNQNIILLHGFIKKTQKTPKRELNKALQILDNI